MRWVVHGERSIYESEWMALRLVDVELPDGTRFEHHVLRVPADAAAAVVHDDERGILLLWRHRFVTDTWGWEIPAGRVDPDETPIEAAERETLEETGWQPGPMRPLGSWYPSNGSIDQTFHVFVADGATRIGDPSDPNEAERVEWITLGQVGQLIRDGQIRDGFSLTGLLWFLAERSS